MRTISQSCTGGYVTGRSAAYEKQALILLTVFSSDCTLFFCILFLSGVEFFALTVL